MNSYFKTPPLVMNLIIINVLVFMAQSYLPADTVMPLANRLALYSSAELFRPWQLVTYMFMHASWPHLFFNMFALWMFGRILEYDLGTKRFIIFYFVSGIGAGLTQLLISSAAAVTVGASGAIFGVLLAFGMLHPNDRIMLLFPPIPMKAKYFVIGYGALELIIGISNPGGSIAHFAHLGGMLWGWLLLVYWRRRARQKAQRRTYR